MNDYKTKDIGFAAFLLIKGVHFKESHNGVFNFTIENTLSIDSLRVEYVNSGYESFHSNLKLLLNLRRK